MTSFSVSSIITEYLERVRLDEEQSWKDCRVCKSILRVRVPFSPPFYGQLTRQARWDRLEIGSRSKGLGVQALSCPPFYADIAQW